VKSDIAQRLNLEKYLAKDSQLPAFAYTNLKVVEGEGNESEGLLIHKLIAAVRILISSHRAQDLYRHT
jgi:hypothetical protein